MLDSINAFLQPPQPKRRRKKRLRWTLVDVAERCMDMDRGQILVIGVTIASYMCLPFFACFLVQPFSVMFFYRNRNDFARTGISEALVLVIVTKTIHIILRVILETLILLTINLGVFLAWKKLRRKIGT